MAKQEDINPEDVGVAIEEDHIEMVYDRSEGRPLARHEDHQVS